MPTKLQLRRGTSAQNDSFTGANGEISYDVTNKTLRVHDGLTAGGYKLARDSERDDNLSVANATILFNDRMQVSNTTLLVNDRLQVANAVAMVSDKLGKTASVTLTGAVTGTANFSANAVSVTTVATSDPTITLGGDLTGAVTLTNLASGTLTATIVDDSHNHTIANVDGLQTDLDTRATWSGLTSTNTAIRSLVTTETARVGLLNTNLTATNTAIRTLVSDRVQVANNTTLLATKAPLASPALTGVPTAPTAANTVSTTQVATTAFVQNVVDVDVAALVDSAPATLNTLNELAAALGDDTNFATTLSTNLGQKLGATASVTLTGAVTGTASFSANAVSVTTVATSDPTVTLTGAVTGAGTLTNLGDVTITTTATADPTITLGGDLSGAVTLTNLASGTLTATVADDSHNHTIANVDGLQTDLDTRATWSGLTATNTAIRTLVSDRVQVANNTTLHATKATWSALTATNTAIRTLVSDRVQVANNTTLLAAKAPLASPALTGTPTAPTAANTVSTTQVATTAFVQNVVDVDIAALVDSAPATLNTLNELAAALGDDTNFATTLSTNLGQKLGGGSSVTLTGAVTGTASFSANAVSVTTVATSDPTITLAGDLSGAVTLTNLGNGTLTATIADDSHNHTIANVDGLQTDLDTRATWSALTATNTAIRILVSDRVQVANNNTLHATKATWSALTSTNTSIRSAITADATAMSIALG